MGVEDSDRRGNIESRFLAIGFYAMFSLALMTSFAILTGIAVLIGWVVFQLS